MHGYVIGIQINFCSSMGKTTSKKKTLNVSTIAGATLQYGIVFRYMTELPDEKQKVRYINTEPSVSHGRKII